MANDVYCLERHDSGFWTSQSGLEGEREDEAAGQGPGTKDQGRSNQECAVMQPKAESNLGSGVAQARQDY